MNSGGFGATSTAGVTPSTAASGPKFSFGTNTSAATGFSFGSVSQPTFSATTGGAQPSASNLLGAASGITTTGSKGLGVPSAQTPALSLAPTSTQPTPNVGFGLSTTQATPLGSALSSSLSTGAVTKPNTAASTGFQLGGTSSLPTAISVVTTTSSGAAASLPALGAKPATATTTAASGTTTTTSTGAKMTYKELEDQMNKWWVELEHQEKTFLEQATKVNAWDKVLIENGQKITELNADVEKVKLDQHRLNHELDFIVAQQKELEEILVPLEDSVAKLPPINYQQHTDTERERTFQIAENIDAQLKRMTEDLKEVIDHLNTGSGSQDSTDPMLQISKILNAHMESLQWVDHNTAMLQRKAEEVARYAVYSKKEHERNFRLAYS